MRYTVVRLITTKRAGHGVKDTLSGLIRFRYWGYASEVKAGAKAAALNGASPHKPGRESGNVFFLLFGAVALVGLVGVAAMQTVRGPVASAVALNLMVRTDSNLRLAGALVAQASSLAADDCDGDAIAEPVAPDTAGPGCADAVAAGGGCIPSGVGGDKADPWGSPVMYCAYDHGNGGAGCGPGRRAGDADPTGQIALAVISAGPDRVFQSTCADAPGYVTRAGDDRAYIFDQAEAAAGGGIGGGLWELKSGDLDTATIAKDLEITTGTTFQGAAVAFDSAASLTLGGLFKLPDDSAFASCLGPDEGALRVFDAGDTLQICDGAGNWLPVGTRNLLGLDDVPDSYAGAAGAFVRVRGDETGVLFGSAVFSDLADVPASYTSAAGRFLRVHDDESGIRFGSAGLLDLDDAPASYAGQGGNVVAVTASEDGIEFVSATALVPAPPESFLDLDDTPASYAGQQNRYVRVNPLATGLQFVAPPPSTLTCGYDQVTSTGTVTATCTAPYVLTGGGCYGGGGAAIALSAPTAAGTGWQCQFVGNGAASVRAVCCRLQ